MELSVGMAFVVSSLATLAGPDMPYEQLLRPSLIALYLSLLVVLLAYPRFAKAKTPSRSSGC
jgi:hypothetical protein